MTAENDLEDLKRKKIKRATAQQLDALEKLGKEMIVIAYYGREIMNQVDDTPTEAGQYAEDRYGQYDGKQQDKAPPEKNGNGRKHGGRDGAESASCSFLHFGTDNNPSLCVLVLLLFLLPLFCMK